MSDNRSNGMSTNENQIRAIIRRSPRVVMSDEMVAHLEDVERRSNRVPHVAAMAYLSRTDET